MDEPANRKQMEDLVRSVTTSIVLVTRDLPWCEHGCPDDGFGYWCSLRPDVVMCAFCFGAAQAMAAAEDFRCSVCGGPAPDKNHDATEDHPGRPAAECQVADVRGTVYGSEGWRFGPSRAPSKFLGHDLHPLPSLS